MQAPGICEAVGQWDFRLVCVTCFLTQRRCAQDLMARGAMEYRNDRPPATLEDLCPNCGINTHFVDFEIDRPFKP